MIQDKKGRRSQGQNNLKAAPTPPRPRQIRSLVAALMGGNCRAQCPIPYLRLPRPNACWVGGDGLTSCTPLRLEGPASSWLRRFQLDFSNTRLLDHGPHPSRAYDTPIELRTRPNDPCQAAARDCGQQHRTGARKVYLSPVTYVFPSTHSRFSNPYSSDR
jgi:hypothetical protein